ncbi:MAG: PDZ domain-containing protein [Steroidobacteraceae bacterium]
MKRLVISMLAMAALAGTTAPAMAQSEEEEVAREQRLADAQRRLEDAAREVAELSGEAAGRAAHRHFEFLLPGPRRAMLGMNLGGAEPNGGGVRVEGVSPGGPAAEAGVKAGDVIVAIEAKPVTTGRELVKAMAAIEPGEKVDLELRRGGKPVQLAVEARPLDQVFLAGPGALTGLPEIRALAAVPAMGEHPFDGDAHWLLAEWGDAEFVTLTPGLGHYFGADKGVLVARAPEDAALGLRDGDVIVAIGGREPQSGPHAMRILRSYQPGEAVELRILRDRRTQTLNAKVPERGTRGVFHRRLAPPPPPTPPAPPTPPEEPAST